MLVHTITNQMVHSLIREHGYNDEEGGFGHIDLYKFDYTREYQVVERVVNVLDGTYFMQVLGSFDDSNAALYDINIRLEYRNTYPHGCYAEYEIWDFIPLRYNWYYGEDKYQADELPYYMCATLAIGAPEDTKYFDDAAEWGEYTAMLLDSKEYILSDVRVSNVEISYFDALTEMWLPKRLTKSIPCAMHILVAQ